MRNVSLQSSTNSIAISRMLNILSTKKGGISVPVKGNLILRHINGLNNGQGEGQSISVIRALALNNMISKLTSSQRNRISDLYNKYKSGEMKESTLVDAVRDMSRQNNKNVYTKNNVVETGLIFNQKA